jgi:hypothetical protein
VTRVPRFTEEDCIHDMDEASCYICNGHAKRDRITESRGSRAWDVVSDAIDLEDVWPSNHR